MLSFPTTLKSMSPEFQSVNHHSHCTSVNIKSCPAVNASKIAWLLWWCWSGMISRRPCVCMEFWMWQMWWRVDHLLLARHFWGKRVRRLFRVLDLQNTIRDWERRNWHTRGKPHQRKWQKSRQSESGIRVSRVSVFCKRLWSKLLVNTDQFVELIWDRDTSKTNLRMRTIEG